MAAFNRRYYAGGGTTTTLANAMAPTDTTFNLVSATGWPGSPGVNFIVVIDRGVAGAEEKILCSSNSGTTVTVAASGRGYDGTSATSHNANASVSLVGGAIDFDEANQISHLLGNMAEGSLPYGKGAGTLPSALAAGAAGTILGSNGTDPGYIAAGASGTVLEGGTSPAFGVLPGTLLATQQYAPGSQVGKSYTTTMAALDTTNLTLAFTVPASGNVDVECTFYNLVNGVSVATCYVSTGLLNHSGGAQVGFTQTIQAVTAADANDEGTYTIRWHLTGLTPGALQLDFAAGVLNNGTSVTLAEVVVDATTGASGKAGPFLMQAFAA